MVEETVGSTISVSARWSITNGSPAVNLSKWNHLKSIRSPSNPLPSNLSASNLWSQPNLLARASLRISAGLKPWTRYGKSPLRRSMKKGEQTAGRALSVRLAACTRSAGLAASLESSAGPVDAGDCVPALRSGAAGAERQSLEEITQHLIAAGTEMLVTRLAEQC